jgi:hypothetical protein
MPETLRTKKLVALACAATLIGSAAFVPAASAQTAQSASSLALGLLPAKDVRAGGKVATNVNRVKIGKTTYRCGKSGTRWYPGNLVSGIRRSPGRGKAWFTNYVAQIRAWQKVKPQTARSRAAIKKIRAAFPAALQRRCALFNSTRINGRKVNLRLVSLRGKKALLLKKTVPAGRRAHTAGAGDNTDSLQVLTAQDTLEAAVTGGSASVKYIFHSPTGDVVAVFNSAATLVGAETAPGCMVARVTAATGVVTCLLDSTRLSGFDEVGETDTGFWDQPVVRFDAAGNTYVSLASSPDQTGQRLYKVDTAGNVTDLVATQFPMCQQRMVVLASGDIYLNAQPMDAYPGGCTGNMSLFHITPSGEVQTLCDGTPLEPYSCFYYTFSATSDGGVLMGGNKNSWEQLGPNDTAIPTQSWLAPSQVTPSPVHGYQDTDCGGDNFGIGVCWGGYLGFSSLMPDGGTIGIVGTYIGGPGPYGSSLMELYPTVRKLNLPDIKVPWFGKRVGSTDKYAVTGYSDADYRFAIYDKSADNDVLVDLPYKMSIYDMQASADGNTLYIAAKRASDGAYLVGRVDVATATLTITSESTSSRGGFLAF